MNQTMIERYPGWSLVTGASSGIGQAFARHLAAQGMNVALVARTRDRLNEMANELSKQHSVSTTAITVDLADPTAAQHISEEMDSLGASVSVLINNAGFGSLGPFHEADPERMIEMVDVNCRAVVDLAARFLPPMVQRGSGAMIVTASMGAYMAVPGSAVYAASKSFDLIFSESLWAELRPHGVDVLGLSPGATATNFRRASGIKGDTNLGGTNSPDDVVAFALAKLGRTPSAVPNWRNRLPLKLNRLLPRRTIISMTHRVNTRRRSR
ncbi:SDR family NAD(P)-dependent oxidoreductase [Candidatus Poriferisocius sp.]|uniref:SDR family NAD(P)-dependent oxidoreductase n=1 Tax=Candidatus Poriferisocius sp. TaxID=3101276 RepID=UPI003B019293